jgi:hypothetical protein
MDYAESKAILLAYAKRKPVKNEDPRFLELLPATRNEPMHFELLVESYLAIREKILLGFVLEEGWPTNQRMPYPDHGVADYSSVSPSHAKRFLAALERLEKGLKEGELKPEETKRLQEIRALLTKKSEEFEKAQEKGSTVPAQGTVPGSEKPKPGGTDAADGPKPDCGDRPSVRNRP